MFGLAPPFIGWWVLTEYGCRCTPATAIAEPAIVDPATPSVRIAGMMIARPMRMVPPRRFPRSAAGWDGRLTARRYLAPAEILPSSDQIHATSIANFLTETANRSADDLWPEIFISPCSGI